MSNSFTNGLFDDFFDDTWFNRDMRKAEKKLYGHRGKNIMNTDIKEHDEGYELYMDLPGFTKDEVKVSLENGYLTVEAAKGRDEDKEDMVDIARRFQNVGYRIFATKGTAKVLNDNGVKALEVHKIEQESPNLLDLILGHEIDLVIDTPTQGRDKSRDGFLIRRTAIETGVNCLTSLDTANALLTSLENTDAKKLTLIDIAQI